MHVEHCVCRITARARSLLRLIPTDPSVVETLDSIGQKVGCRIYCIYNSSSVLHYYHVQMLDI